MRLRSLVLSVSLAGLLAGCCSSGLTDPKEVAQKIAANGMYWQRKDATSAIWMQGPKAQETLNRDISRCVREGLELERLGQIKSAFPAEKKDKEDANGDKDREDLMAFDIPERDGALLVEHQQFDDFETCMISKGWERIMYVPYDVSVRGADTYLQNHIEQKSRTIHEKKDQKDEKKSPYDHLN